MYKIILSSDDLMQPDRNQIEIYIFIFGHFFTDNWRFNEKTKPLFFGCIIFCRFSQI
jgi:hypothetical protein